MSSAKGFSKAALLLGILFLSLPLTANAEIFAKFEPAGPGTSVYESELVQLNLVVFNSSNLDQKNIVMSAYTDQGLSLVLEGGEQAKKIEFIVSELKAGQMESRPVQVIGLKPSAKAQKIHLDYSDSNTPYSSSLSMPVLKSPVSLNARLAAGTVGPGEKSNAIISIKNSSNSEVSNISASLFVPSGITTESEISLPKLGPGESLSDRELGFEVSKGAEGNYPIIVRAGFTDASGNHVLQKQLSLSVGFGFSLTLAVLIILFLFVLGAFVFSGKRRRKESFSQAKKEAELKAESEPEEATEEDEDVFEEEPPEPKQMPKPGQKPKPKEKAKPKGKKK